MEAADVESKGANTFDPPRESPVVLTEGPCVSNSDLYITDLTTPVTENLQPAEPGPQEPEHEETKPGIPSSSSCITMTVPVYIDHTPTTAIVDTGAQVTVANKSLCTRAGIKTEEGRTINIHGVGSDMGMKAEVAVKVPITIGNGIYNWTILVADIREDLILGLDFLYEVGASLNFQQGILQIGDAIIMAKYITDATGQQQMVTPVTLAHQITIPAAHCYYVDCHIGSEFDPGDDILIDPVPTIPSMVAGLVKCQTEVRIPLPNLTGDLLTLPVGAVIATAHQVCSIYPFVDKEDKEDQNPGMHDGIKRVLNVSSTPTIRTSGTVDKEADPASDGPCNFA